MNAKGRLNTLRYRPELCTGCGMCALVCPLGVFSPEDSPARLLSPERCIECGACSRNCPAGALEVETGMGCAAALMKAALTGRDAAACGCDDD